MDLQYSLYTDTDVANIQFIHGYRRKYTVYTRIQTYQIYSIYTDTDLVLNYDLTLFYLYTRKVDAGEDLDSWLGDLNGGRSGGCNGHAGG